jgi:hypothetical protein
MRFRTRAPGRHALFALMIGPGGEDYTDAELAAAWQVYGDEIMDWKAAGPPSRPWGWWVFEAGEEPPAADAEPVRLAELGMLTASELASAAESANEAKARQKLGYAEWQIHHGVERVERESIDLYERVLAAGREA